MVNTLYANVDSHLVSPNGGQCAVLAVAATSVKQGNAGTSQPCKTAYVSALCASALHFGINSSANLTGGALIPTVAAVSLISAEPLEIAVDDVSKLYFYAGTAASVYITYRQ